MTNQVKKGRLKNVSFNFKATEENELGAHLAYTMASDGGAASGFNDPVLLKSKNVNKRKKEVLEDLQKRGIQVAEKLSKATDTLNVGNLLADALNNLYCTPEYNWCYCFVETFTVGENSSVIYWCDGKYFAQSYTLDEASKTLTFTGDAVEVTPVTNWETSYKTITEAVEGNQDLTMFGELIAKAAQKESFKQNLIKACGAKVKKEGMEDDEEDESTEDADNKDKEVTVHKTASKGKKQKVTKMEEKQLEAAVQEQIAKAQADLEKKYQEQIAKSQAQFEEAQAQIAALQKAADDSAKGELALMLKAFSFLGDEEVESLVGALHKNAALESVLVALDKAAKAVEAVTTQTVGVSATTQEVQKATSVTEDESIAKQRELIKQRFAKK